jgi:hypothetical protein
MPLPSPLRPSIPVEQPPPKRTLASRFDVEPVAISLNKRFKTSPKASPLTSNNPLSDSDTDTMSIEPPPKKKKSAFQKYGEVIGKTKEELSRRDRRMQRFAEMAAASTPPRVDTPDYARDVQMVNPLFCCDAYASQRSYLMMFHLLDVRKSLNDLICD